MKAGICVLFVLCVLTVGSYCYPAEDAKPVKEEKFACVCVKKDKCNITEDVLQDKDGDIAKETDKRCDATIHTCCPKKLIKDVEEKEHLIPEIFKL